MKIAFLTTVLILVIALSLGLVTGCAGQTDGKPEPPTLPVESSSFEPSQTLPIESALSEPTNPNEMTDPVTQTSETPDSGFSGVVYGNGEVVVEQDDWLYFTVSEIQALDQPHGLYRIRPDGSQRTMLHAGYQIHQIHITGDWLYFVQSETVEDGTPISVEVYKIRTDGSQVTRLMTLQGHDIDKLWIVEDWIYLGVIDQDWHSSISKVKTDGSSYMQLVTDFSLVAVQDVEILALDNQGELNRLTIDGKQPVRIGQDIHSRLSTRVEKGWIYYSNELDRWNLYKLRPDGTGQQKLTSEPVFNFCISNGKLFYQLEATEYNPDAKAGQIVRIDLDGTARQVIANPLASDHDMDFVTLLGAANGWIYCREMTWDDESPDTYHSTLFRFDAYGTNRMVLVEYECMNAG
jgi:hypothetical protein